MAFISGIIVLVKDFRAVLKVEVINVFGGKLRAVLLIRGS
jgi:hypothetical protein